MSEQDRRTFLKRAACAVPGAAVAASLGVTACTPEGETPPARPTTGTLPTAPLRAVANVVLPSGVLGEDAMAAAVGGFMDWVEGFEPAAELDHPYLTGELRYGPPHPGPRWAAQLEAMDLESQRRSGLALAELGAEERRRVVERALSGGSLPGRPALADHVALGLLAWFYRSSEANDLCYGAEVGRHLCRGIASLPGEPAKGGE